MGLDARIPLMAQGMNLEPRSNALMRASQLEGLQQANALRQMQMQQMQQAAQQTMLERQAAAQREQSMMGYLQSMSGQAGPPQPFNPAEAVQRLGIDGASKLQGLMASSANMGRAKVARTVEIAGPDGKPMTVQLDEFGGTVGSQMPKPVEMRMANTGGAQTPYNPYAQTAPIPMTLTPSQIQSNATTIRGQNMQDGRARERMTFDMGQANAESGGPSQVAFTKQFGKAAPGYRWKADGSQEAIPGGPADIKAGEAGARRDRQVKASMAQADRVIEKVDSAIGDTGMFSAGAGSVLADVPGLPARNLRSTLDTIKANLGFAELQAMRDASPTGGALGAIAVQELTALQSTVASLDQGQSPEKLRESLGQIKKHYQAWKEAVASANGAPPPAQPPRLQMPGNPNSGAMDIFGQADAILRGGK